MSDAGPDGQAPGVTEEAAEEAATEAVATGVTTTEEATAEEVTTDAEVEEPERFCPLEVIAVEVVLPESHARLVLQELSGDRRVLTIPIVVVDANAIVYARDRLQTPRPLTHELFSTALAAYGVVVETVRITAAEGSAFRAEVVLSGGGGLRILDCRPTDGIALALRQPLPVPITAASTVLDQLGVVGS